MRCIILAVEYSKRLLLSLILLAAFLLSAAGARAADNHLALVDQAYRIVLQRPVDDVGAQVWPQMLSAGELALSELYVGLLTCSEYRALQGVDSTYSHVRSFYRVLLGREPAVSEVDSWINSGLSIANIARRFVAYYGGAMAAVSIDKDTLRPLSGEDNAPAITAFVALVRQQANFAPGVYEISTSIKLRPTFGLTLQSASGDKAIFKAARDFCSGPILHVMSGDRLQVLNIVLDGNISQRRAAHNYYWDYHVSLDPDLRNTQSNAIFEDCTECVLRGFESINAVGASGLIIWGRNCTIEQCVFRNNGWGLNLSPDFGEWADGLTIVSGPGFQVFDNDFCDNSDIDLVIGNLQNGVVSWNRITHGANWSFSALSLTNFYNSALSGFYGARIENNTIDCSGGMCGFGITVGPYYWGSLDYMGQPLAPLDGGSVRNNRIVGARQGIAIMGARGVTLMDNQVLDCGGWQLPNGNTTGSLDVTAGDTVSCPGLQATTSQIIPQLAFDGTLGLDICDIFNAQEGCQ